MADNFKAIVEVKDAELSHYLEKMLSAGDTDSVCIGTFSSSTSVLKLEDFPIPLCLRIAENTRKKSLSFQRSPKGRAFKSVPGDFSLSGEILPLTSCLLNLAERDETASLLRKRTMRLEEEVNREKLPRFSFTLREETAKQYTQRLEVPELKEYLLSMFTERPEMGLEEIQAVLDQPRGHITSVIRELCDKRRERNRSVFSLKSIYLLADKENGKKIGEMKKTKS